MKLTLVQYIAFGFVLGWVLGDVIGAVHSDKLYMATSTALVIAYLNNAHGIIWQRLKNFVKGNQKKKC